MLTGYLKRDLQGDLRRDMKRDQSFGDGGAIEDICVDWIFEKRPAKSEKRPAKRPAKRLAKRPT